MNKGNVVPKHHMILSIFKPYEVWNPVINDTVIEN